MRAAAKMPDRCADRERDCEGRGINGSATDYRTLVPAIGRPSSATSNASAMAL